MHCQIFCRFAVVLTLLAACLSLATASPFSYRLQFAFPPTSPPLAYANARFDLRVGLDTDSLQPSFDGYLIPLSTYRTGWPVTNTTAVLTVTGGSPVDGVYSDALISGNWSFWDQPQGDSITFPTINFLAPTSVLRFNPIAIHFEVDHFPTVPTTLGPQAFDSTSVTGAEGPLIFAREQALTLLSASAVPVPEPGAAVLGALAIVANRFRRRRRG